MAQTKTPPALPHSHHSEFPHPAPAAFAADRAAETPADAADSATFSPSPISDQSTPDTPLQLPQRAARTPPIIFSSPPQSATPSSRPDHWRWSESNPSSKPQIP